MAKYIAARDIKSEAHVAFWMFAFDFFFILIYLVISYTLCNLVANELHIPFMIFSVVCSITLTLPSPYNRRRRLFQTLLIYFKRDRTVYHPITKKMIEERGKR